MRHGTPGNRTHQRVRLVVALTLGAALGCGPGPHTAEAGAAAAAEAGEADQRVGAPAAEAVDTASGLLRPAADHHKHLPSPAAAELVDGAPLPPVELPRDLAGLLRERERRWNDSTALAELYTEDVTALGGDRDWIDGRSAVAAHVASLFGSAYRITPISHGVEESSGYIAAYLTRGEADSAAHFGSLLLALERAPGGAWRIAAETPTFPGPAGMVPITADQLVQQLDEAGIGRAVVLSVAYWFGAPQFELENELARVRAENDWTARQVARYPDRLVGFCSFNPLEDYALEELERCAGELGLRGLKLHFGSSDVDVLDSEHLERVRAVFAAANRLRLPIVVHSRARSAREYGREHALTFVNQILPAAPDVPVQIAHLWGGARFSPPALQLFAEAVAVGNPRTRNLYFDVTDIMRAIVDSDEALTTVAARIREIGTDRILWGSDTSPPLPAPREAWLEFQALPLTDEEFRSIANNIAPYLR